MRREPVIHCLKPSAELCAFFSPSNFPPPFYINKRHVFAVSRIHQLGLKKKGNGDVYVPRALLMMNARCVIFPECTI